MKIVGYAGVSHQSLEAQSDALTAAGCGRIFSDNFSGAREDRPGLARLLDYVRPGDTVVVVALDRLGRSLSSVIRTVETLTNAEVLLRGRRRVHHRPHPQLRGSRHHLPRPQRTRPHGHARKGTAPTTGMPR